MNKQRILITGGSGFLGCHLKAELKKRGGIVLGTGVHPRSNDQELIRVALEDKNGLKNVIENFRPTWIIHLAAIALVTHNDHRQIYSTNILGTENLLDAIAQAKVSPPTVILASTAGVYGNQSVSLLNESLNLNPLNHYSYSKMIMELMSKKYSEKIKIHIIRPFNIIGQGQSKQFLVPKIVQHFAQKKKKLSLGNISSIRDYVEVSYCAKILSDLIEISPPEPITVNLCSGRGWSGHDILDIMQRISNHHPVLEISDALIRSSEVWRMVGDPFNLQRHLDTQLKFAHLEDILYSMYNFEMALGKI